MGKRRRQSLGNSSDSSSDTGDTDYEELLEENRRLRKKLKRSKYEGGKKHGRRRGRRRHRRTSESSAASGNVCEENQEIYSVAEAQNTGAVEGDPLNFEYVDVPEPDVLQSEVIAALGGLVEEEATKQGEEIHKDLVKRWEPILRSGLDDDTKQNLIKKYPTARNCPLIDPPTLNPEVKSAAKETALARDVRLQEGQKQMAAALSALGTALSNLLGVDDDEGDGARVSLIEMLSDAARLVADLHFMESKSRQNLISLNLDQSLKEVLNLNPLDGFLFGNNLTDNLKVVKAIKKAGAELRTTAKSGPVKKHLNAKQPLRRGPRLSGGRVQERVPPHRKYSQQGFRATKVYNPRHTTQVREYKRRK